MCQNIRFDLLYPVEDETGLSLDQALALTDAAGADLIEPDRAKDREEPAVEPRPRIELMAAFERAHAGRLHQILGGIALPGQQDSVTPKTAEMLRQTCPHLALTLVDHAGSDTKSDLGRAANMGDA